MVCYFGAVDVVRLILVCERWIGISEDDRGQRRPRGSGGGGSCCVWPVSCLLCLYVTVVSVSVYSCVVLSSVGLSGDIG